MTLEELLASIRDAYWKAADANPTAAPTHLYIGQAEWELLRDVYCVKSEQYCNLKVVQVREHFHLGVGRAL